MRGLKTHVAKIRHQVFTEVARIAYESDNLFEDIESIPFKVCPGEVPTVLNSIYHERAIVSERVRLALGLSLRPEDRHVRFTTGIEESLAAEKYYEPPLMQVIPSACQKCEDHKFVVTDQCMGCTAHPCTTVCPRKAISRVQGKAFINQDLCAKCGKCKKACPYDAIAYKKRPCLSSCGVRAIGIDQHGRAKINNDICVSCGMCMVSCPFGAIADKSQIFQLIRCLKQGEEVIAEIAPAFPGQFGTNATQRNVKASLLKLGFAQVYEVALGADIGAIVETHHFVEKVVKGDQPFMLTSCCPAWAVLAKRELKEMAGQVSQELTPMVATARSIKQKHPQAKVVFIGPCTAKKLEAMRRTVRSDVDFVITFEELWAMFRAKNLEPTKCQGDSSFHDATGAGRGYAASGGVIKAINKCLAQYYPEIEIKTDHVEGLFDCKKMLLLAKAGKRNGYLIEGMGCPGGCIGGAGTIMPIEKAREEIEKTVSASSQDIPPVDLLDIKLN